MLRTATNGAKLADATPHPDARPVTPATKQPTNGATPATPASPPFRSPHLVQLRWLHDAVGKDIRVRLLDGKMIAGELMEFDQFTLSVWPTNSADAWLIFKHAIAAIAASEPGGNGAAQGG